MRCLVYHITVQSFYTVCGQNVQSVWYTIIIPMKITELYLREARNEAIWFHVKHKGYNGTQIAKMFNVTRSNAHNIIKSMPENWETKWTKRS